MPRCSNARRSGEIKLAVAFHEPHARYDLFAIDTIAKRKAMVTC
jgi:hypothetical protein